VDQHLMAMAGWDMAVAAARERAASAAKPAQRPLIGTRHGMNG